MYRFETCTIAMADVGGSAGESAARIVRAPLTSAQLSGAPINPVTGLATDYLNHFNEAIMLFEMLASSPDCRDDLKAWQPISYRAHFRHSGFAGRDIAIAAYDAADPALRDMLETLTGTMTALIERTRTAILDEPNARLSTGLAERAAGWLRLLVAQAAAVINGQRAPDPHSTPQSVVDRMIK